MKKTTFYILSFTWGLPLTLVGLLVAAVLRIAGKRPKRWGYCYYFEVGKGWGGLELGLIFLTDSTPFEHTKCHEHGHAIQNCFFGPFMPFIVSIPSAIRYWWRHFTKATTPYDAIWFEGQATRLGKKLYDEEITG